MGLIAGVLCIVALEACGAAREFQSVDPQAPAPTLFVPGEQPFDISLVPAVPVPIRLGTDLGFRVSTGSAGYASLYLINPEDEVWVLAENMPVAAGNVDYPTQAQGFTLTAAEPLGVNRVILLVTREPFDGFSGGNTLTTVVGLAIRGDAFVGRLNGTTRSLQPSEWAIDEIAVSIVA